MPSGCLEWTGSTNRDGYGTVKIAGCSQLVHRVIWELEYGPIPDGLLVCHTCDNPPCGEGSHLFTGTQLENVADRSAKGRTARGVRSGASLHPESYARGEDHVGARLTVQAVLEIFRNPDNLSQRERARRYGVSHTTVQAILKGIRWRHITRASA